MLLRIRFTKRALLILTNSFNYSISFRSNFSPRYPIKIRNPSHSPSCPTYFYYAEFIQHKEVSDTSTQSLGKATKKKFKLSTFSK
jgi:hypothetical protein